MAKVFGKDDPPKPIFIDPPVDVIAAAGVPFMVIALLGAHTFTLPAPVIVPLSVNVNEPAPLNPSMVIAWLPPVLNVAPPPVPVANVTCGLSTTKAALAASILRGACSKYYCCSALKCYRRSVPVVIVISHVAFTYTVPVVDSIKTLLLAPVVNVSALLKVISPLDSIFIDCWM